MPLKPKNGPSAQEKEREAANRAGEARREKEKAARRSNADKQKRYRESMKAQGYKARLIWEKPPAPGMVKTTTYIHENSLNIAVNNPAIKEALDRLSGTFIHECKKQKTAEKVWEPVYRDLLRLIKPLGIEE
jgi:hypothetical protein